jgi:hypothetical protein
MGFTGAMPLLSLLGSVGSSLMQAKAAQKNAAFEIAQHKEAQRVRELQSMQDATRAKEEHRRALSAQMASLASRNVDLYGPGHQAAIRFQGEELMRELQSIEFNAASARRTVHLGVQQIQSGARAKTQQALFSAGGTVFKGAQDGVFDIFDKPKNKRQPFPS